MEDVVNSYLNNFKGLLNALPPIVQEVVVVSLILLFFFLLRKIFTTYILKMIFKMLSRTNYEVNEKTVFAFKGPLQVFFLVTGIYVALLYLPFNQEWKLLFTKLFRSIIIILITWVFYNLQDLQSILFDKLQKKLNFQVDKILLPFLSKFLRAVTIIIAFTIIVQEWGYNINGLIAGLGLGGLALAMAAKDALANIFGGVVILVDKPFSIGDWITTSSVEGTVEDINFRSTKIRTFAQALVTVPNSTLANEAITNWSKMGKRRITFHLGISYTTPRNKLEKCINEIRTMLEKHPEIHKETIFVQFENFGDSSLELFLYFFTITTEWGQYLKVKEDVNLKIMEILEREGVSVALPSRSIYLETQNDVVKG